MSGDPDGIVRFDAGRATEVGREMTDDAVFVTGVYTPDEYATVFVSTTLREHYEDDEMDIQDAGEIAQQYGQLDFVEREAFPDMYPTLESTHAFATFTDFATIVRIVGDDEAFYISFEAGTEIAPVVDELRDIVAESG